MPIAVGPPETAQNAPVIIDLGKKKKGEIKKLRNGEGPLLDEVNGCIEELKTSGAIAGNAQLVVVVIRQKPSRKPLLWPMQ